MKKKYNWRERTRKKIKKDNYREREFAKRESEINFKRSVRCSCNSFQARQ